MREAWPLPKRFPAEARINEDPSRGFWWVLGPRSSLMRASCNARKLVTGPLGRSGPQVLCRGVGNDLLRPLSLSRGCPLHWADGPAFTGG